MPGLVQDYFSAAFFVQDAEPDPNVAGADEYFLVFGELVQGSFAGGYAFSAHLGYSFVLVGCQFASAHNSLPGGNIFGGTVTSSV